MIYLIYAIFLFLLVFSVMGFYTSYNLAHIKMRPRVKIENYSNSALPDNEIEDIRNWVSESKKEYYLVKSPYLYKLNILEIEGASKDKWVLLLHGVTHTHENMINFAYMYNKLGYSVALWDARNHGDSGGKNVSYGYYEKGDLKEVIDNLRIRHGKKIKIGLHGISMGAGILLMYAVNVRDDCDFYIADCSYSIFINQVKSIISKKIKSKGLILKIIISFTAFFQKKIFKYDLNSINIMKKIHRLNNPILFFNCKDDDYIPPYMTEELYNSCNSDIKRIKLFNEGGHGGSYYLHPNEYTKEVKEFLNEMNF